MLDIKEVITILCKYLSDTIGSTLSPEFFRSAKYNKNSEELTKAFWNTLDKLTYLALESENINTYIANFDPLVRTKLRLAYLQYPSIDIYCLSSSNYSSSRSILVAFTWLITKQDVLKNIVRLKLLSSSLGREFSSVETDNKENGNPKLSTLPNQVNNLLHKSNKLNNNLKAICELNMEKVKLMTKVHAASITTSGLPHLTVSEMALIKKLATSKDISEIEFEKIKEMEKTAVLLDLHIKWNRKNHIFYTWMTTVLDEHDKDNESMFTEEALKELARFIYLLRHMIKKRLKTLKNNDNPSDIINLIKDCPSRYLRVQKYNTETQICLHEISNQFETINSDLIKKRNDLEIELKSILDFIPSCLRINL